MGSAVHPYLPNSPPNIKQKMLEEIGAASIDDLYDDIPPQVRFKRKLNLPPSHSEFELKKRVQNILAKNRSTSDLTSFLGAGCYNHHIPAVVTEIVNRSEFLTSYTSYQAEVSQGMLQALFEYQSLICDLTGMAYADSSLYDWSTALGEAGLMAARITGRNTLLIPRIIHPERKNVLHNFTEPHDIKIVEVEYERDSGRTDLADLDRKLDADVAAVYVETPSYFGILEENAEEIGKRAHAKGARYITGVDLISLGLLKPPGEYGADIVVAEGQPLGNPMNYGGPGLGVMACAQDNNLLRQMPGRIIGATTNIEGNQRGFSMVLQTREQHIRRERATSNICTNQALNAVAAAAYLSALGPLGLRQLGEAIALNTNYAISILKSVKPLKVPAFKGPHFKEFLAQYPKGKPAASEVNRRLLARNILGGKLASKEFPELGESAIFCVTETTTKEEIDALRDALQVALEA